MTVKIDADTTSGLQLESDTSGIIDIQSGGTTKMTVGTTIDIQGNELVLDADGDTSIHADTDDQIDFKTGGSDRMRIDASGVVTIGGNTVLATAGSTLSQNGYQKFSNGYTIQWGKHTSASSSFTVTYPVAFSTVYSIVLTPFDTGTDTGGVSNADTISPDSSVGTSSFVVSHYTPMEGIYWIATGSIS